MSKKDFFKMLGAPLANVRWSWGSIRESDGAVFLQVWQDRVRMHEGRRFVQVTHTDGHGDDPDDPGHRERFKHVEHVRAGAPCYLVMCQAVDVAAMPRKIKQFDTRDVFETGRLIELDGDWWVEQGRRVPVLQVLPARKAPPT